MPLSGHSLSECSGLDSGQSSVLNYIVLYKDENVEECIEIIHCPSDPVKFKTVMGHMSEFILAPNG